MQVGTSRLLALSPTENIRISSSELFLTLEQNGYAVEKVIAADRYVPALEQSAPDLALLPLTSDGESLLNQIVGMESHPPVLVFGESGQAELAGKFMQAGADEYFLADQIDQVLLQQLVDRTIDFHRTIVALRDQTAKLQDELAYVSRDQHEAFDVQQKLMPKPQQFGDISFAYHLLPRSGMSGDSVNCFELSDGRLLFYLADVAGHGALGGVIATALTMTAKNLTDDDFDASGQTSSDLLVWFNQAMLALKLERHVAMFLGVISADRSSLEYSSAAHFPGTILCQADTCTYLELGGLPLGVCEAEYESRAVKLHDIFELVLFSDGVLEILPQDTLENREKHLISLVESGSRSIGAISSELSLADRTEVPDDIALLTIRRIDPKEDRATA